MVVAVLEPMLSSMAILMRNSPSLAFLEAIIQPAAALMASCR